MQCNCTTFFSLSYTPCLCRGSGSQIDCTYSNFIGCKIRILLYSFFKQFTFPSVCNEWAELHTLRVQLKCVLHLFPVHPGDVFTYPGKTYPLSLLQEKSGSRHRSPLNMVQLKAIDVRLSQIIVTRISQTASPALSYWAFDPLPVDLKGHFQFSESEVLAFPAGMCLLQPMLLEGCCIYCAAACCACVYTSLPLCVCGTQSSGEFAAEPGWSRAELLLELIIDQRLLYCVCLDEKHNKEVCL